MNYVDTELTPPAQPYSGDGVGVHENNGGNIKLRKKPGALIRQPLQSQLVCFHAPAAASSMVTLSDDPDMAQLLPGCMEDALVRATRLA